MAFTYDLTTDGGKVRLLIPDNQQEGYIFEDEEIDAFLLMESSVRRAAALALETMASNEAYVLKVITLLDLKTDGAKTAEALMKRAKVLRDQADREDDATDGGLFDIAEWVVDDFSSREYLWNRRLRGVV